MASATQEAPDAPASVPAERSPRRELLGGAIVIALFLSAACLGDAVYIEPFRLQVTHYDLKAPVFAPLKIAQLSDLHTHGMRRNEKHMLQILNQEKPDAIVITGDCLGNLAGNYEWCKQLYQQLHAPLGVWFVHGNWENDRPVHREKQFYREAGINLLVNANVQLRPNVWLIGLDDPSSGWPRPDIALAGVPQDAYKIAIFHSPGYFRRMAGRVNLCLAGHTHGGQVRIPFVKPFWLPHGAKPYLEGWYEMKGSKMYVSRGIGMSNLQIRFLCRPEISFFTLHP